MKRGNSAGAGRYLFLLDKHTSGFLYRHVFLHNQSISQSGSQPVGHSVSQLISRVNQLVIFVI